MHDIKAAIEAATFTQLDDIAKSVWGGYGTLFDDHTAQALGNAIEARRAVLKAFRHQTLGNPSNASTGHPRGHGGHSASQNRRGSDRQRSIARRRQLAASGAVPGSIAVNFTQGELAVLSVIAREIRRTGACDWFMDKIAALAGVSRTTTRNALRQAQALGLISLKERRRNRWRSDSNVITIIAKEWTAWLRLGGGCKKPTTTSTNKVNSGDDGGIFRVDSGPVGAVMIGTPYGKDRRTESASLDRRDRQ